MQCPCGGDSKATPNERPWRVCERCGRVVNRIVPHPLFDLPPLTAAEYVALRPQIEQARKSSKWAVAHEHEIIDAIREGRL